MHSEEDQAVGCQESCPCRMSEASWMRSSFALPVRALRTLSPGARLSDVQRSPPSLCKQREHQIHARRCYVADSTGGEAHGVRYIHVGTGDYCTCNRGTRTGFFALDSRCIYSQGQYVPLCMCSTMRSPPNNGVTVIHKPRQDVAESRMVANARGSFRAILVNPNPTHPVQRCDCS